MSTTKQSINPERSVAIRWSARLADLGWTPVVSTFLETYSDLEPPITTAEAMFLIHLISYKWDERPPHPAFKTLAKRMGLSIAAVRSHARKLEQKGYIRREIRLDNTNLFYLDPLFRALEATLSKDNAAKPFRGEESVEKVATNVDFDHEVEQTVQSQ